MLLFFKILFTIMLFVLIPVVLYIIKVAIDCEDYPMILFICIAFGTLVFFTMTFCVSSSDNRELSESCVEEISEEIDKIKYKLDEAYLLYDSGEMSKFMLDAYNEKSMPDKCIEYNTSKNIYLVRINECSCGVDMVQIVFKEDEDKLEITLSPYIAGNSDIIYSKVITYSKSA